ncbi:hypothetical protein CLV47_1037 [Antricoccus suffuscus]|uniref:Uncharacterized protein n=1 Tax=Antricoccus suffuscus TaxID=1629062 RepID=A0A2T1A392_9ACTN|nr:hypothetical protein [Antricoccus suffuscus]PRZ42957.1 hypothetical protein CLV47_1037 [Antricoccus suffuscus]
MRFTAATLDQLRMIALRFFGLGAVAVFVPMMFLVLMRGMPTAIRIVLIVVEVVGVMLVGAGLGAFMTADKWNKKRRAGWTPIDIHVVPDDAAGEIDKTLLDTNDRRWRIAMARYPLAVRDVLIADHTIEYVGELEHDKPVLLRPAADAGRSYESFGHVKSLAELKPDG